MRMAIVVGEVIWVNADRVFIKDEKGEIEVVGSIARENCHIGQLVGIKGSFQDGVIIPDKIALLEE